MFTQSTSVYQSLNQFANENKVRLSPEVANLLSNKNESAPCFEEEIAQWAQLREDHAVGQVPSSESQTIVGQKHETALEHGAEPSTVNSYSHLPGATQLRQLITSLRGIVFGEVVPESKTPSFTLLQRLQPIIIRGHQERSARCYWRRDGSAIAVSYASNVYAKAVLECTRTRWYA